MTEDFLTMGLRKDRYLKAIELLEQFDEEIKATIRDIGQRMMKCQPDLFIEGVEGDVRLRRKPFSSKSWARVDYEMDPNRTPAGQQQHLNVHLYWISPTEYDRHDVDGALRAFGYKIKGASTETDTEVIQAMGDNSMLDTAPDPFGDNTVFYRHVSSKTEIEETAEAMINHFETFGNRYSGE
ncbi:hypothetical protein [Halorubrum sp. HHNYT27]|uniref:hypothetical protein n=1 Tax=Halorubrum sp. HHNYT27 TaxID=3402275 RepID=UPI003EBB366E